MGFEIQRRTGRTHGASYKPEVAAAAIDPFLLWYCNSARPRGVVLSADDSPRVQAGSVRIRPVF